MSFLPLFLNSLNRFVALIFAATICGILGEIFFVCGIVCSKNQRKTKTKQCYIMYIFLQSTYLVVSFQSVFIYLIISLFCVSFHFNIDFAVDALKSYFHCCNFPSTLPSCSLSLSLSFPSLPLPLSLSSFA